METLAPRFTLASLASALGGVFDGPGDIPLDHPVGAGEDDPLGVTFAENERYLSSAENSNVGAIIVSRSAPASSKPLIRVDNPRMAFGMFLAMSVRGLPLNAGIHATAIVEGASIDKSASVGAYCVIEAGASIGPRCKIYPFCYIGAECVLEADVILYPHVALYRDVAIGEKSMVHSGTVLGSDGFGYIWTGKERMKVPQAGRVTIGPNVEIGANTTIDRATAGSTSIGAGSKIDNLVQIAHNVSVGEHAAIAAQTGISGSSKIGDRVTMGGNVGIADHVTIASDVVLGARSGVAGDITEPGGYLGAPARPGSEAKRSMLLGTKLPEMLSRIRELEKRVEELERGKD